MMNGIYKLYEVAASHKIDIGRQMVAQIATEVAKIGNKYAICEKCVHNNANDYIKYCQPCLSNNKSNWEKA